MAIEYRWEFPSLGVTYNQGRLTNVVSTAYFNLIAEEDGVSVYLPSSINLSSPSSAASFTPYEQVTKEQVQAWTEEALGAAKVQIFKDKLAAQLLAKKAPVKGDMNPPWV
jgi:hypothetical protein